MGTQVAVNNQQELASAFSAAKSGDTIILSPGDYGDVSLRRAEFSEAVTIISADPENPSVFNTLSFVDVTNVTVASVAVNLEVTETTSAGVRGVSISGSEGVTFRDSVVLGGDAVVGVPTDTDPATIPNGVPYLGEPIGNAIYVTRSDDITLSGNDVSGFQRGITLLYSDSVSVSENEIHDLRSTPFRSIFTDNVAVEGNEFYDFNPINLGGQGDHGTFINFRNADITGNPTINIVVKDNFINQGDGLAIRGIVFSSYPESPGFENVVVDNNVIYNGDHAGMVLTNIHSGLITNNTLIQSSGDDLRLAPGIRVEDASSDLTIENNLASEVVIIGDRVDTDSVVIRNNLDVQSLHPDEPNYVGNLLLNGLVNPEVATITDFAVLPDLVSQDIGAVIDGASDLSFDADITKSDRNSLTVTFDTDASTEGQAEQADVQYVFSFADGTMLEGPSVTYSFATPGRHEVTLTKTSGDRVETVTRIVEVFDPVKIALADAGDITTTGQKFALEGDVTLDNARATFESSGSYIKIDGAAATLAHASEFSATFRFAFDEPSEGREYLARVTQSFTVFAQGDDLTAIFWLDNGETIWLRGDVPGLQSGQAFEVGAVFDAETGDAGLYVDGVLLDAAANIEADLGAGGNAGLYVGGFGAGGNFQGWIEDFTIQTDSSKTAPSAIAVENENDFLGSVQDVDHFTDEVLRETTVQIDTEDTANWSQVTTIADGNGTLIEREIEYDNGNLRLDTYEAGQLAERLSTEADGDMRLITYEDGQRASIVKEDVSEIKSWSTQVITYDANNKIATKSIAYDNGTTTETSYTDGMPDWVLRSDLDDAFSWTTVATLYEAGELFAHDTTFDNGDITVFVYEDGERDVRLNLDGDDSNAWTFQLTVFEDTRNVTTTYDAPEDLPGEYSYLVQGTDPYAVYG